MQTTIKIPDDDKGREYSLDVTFSVRSGHDDRLSVDLERVSLDECRVWFGSRGEKVAIDGDSRPFIERWITTRYHAEIVDQCLEYWRDEQHYREGAA